MPWKVPLPTFWWICTDSVFWRIRKEKPWNPKGISPFGFAGFSAKYAGCCRKKEKRGSQPTNTSGRSPLLPFLRKTLFQYNNPVTKAFWNPEVATVIESSGKTKFSPCERKSPLLENLWKKTWWGRGRGGHKKESRTKENQERRA